jgi:hypothetical protein
MLLLLRPRVLFTLCNICIFTLLEVFRIIPYEALCQNPANSRTSPVDENCCSAKVLIADRDTKGAQSLADELNKKGKVVWVETVNVTDWDEQVKAFEAAISEFGRIDYVYPIAGIGVRP